MSFTRTTRTTLTLISVLAAAGTTTGCDELGFLDGLEKQSSLVQVFATHHATALDGGIPDRGADGEHRVFETDEGWTVTLTQGFFVTTGVTLHRCSGDAEPIDLFWGTVAEDVREADLDLFTLGSVELKPTALCAVTVHYGPYDADDGATVDAPGAVDGATVYLHGIAERAGVDGEPDEAIPFEIRAEGRLDVDLDVSQLDDGKPLRITGDEPFPVELTLSKTYDRFFDAIDVTQMSQIDMDEHVLAVLAGVTRIDPGTRIAP